MGQKTKGGCKCQVCGIFMPARSGGWCAACRVLSKHLAALSGYDKRGGSRNVRNFMALNQKAPTPGTGWGCFVCGLPPDGALAVLCDHCLSEDRQPTRAFKGYAKDKETVPIEELTGHHEHDMSRHRGEGG